MKIYHQIYVCFIIITCFLCGFADEDFEQGHVLEGQKLEDVRINITIKVQEGRLYCQEIESEVASVKFVNWLGEKYWEAMQKGRVLVFADVVFQEDCTLLQRSAALSLIAPPVRNNVLVKINASGGVLCRSVLSKKYANQGYLTYASLEHFVGLSRKEVDEIKAGRRFCDYILRAEDIGRAAVLDSSKTIRDLQIELAMFSELKTPLYIEWTFDDVTYCEHLH